MGGYAGALFIKVLLETLVRSWDNLCKELRFLSKERIEEILGRSGSDLRLGKLFLSTV